MKSKETKTDTIDKTRQELKALKRAYLISSFEKFRWVTVLTKIANANKEEMIILGIETIITNQRKLSHVNIP